MNDQQKRIYKTLMTVFRDCNHDINQTYSALLGALITASSMREDGTDVLAECVGTLELARAEMSKRNPS